jgi:radical SAM superfamily enzyme YgiQ (UPF0313 family)
LESFSRESLEGAHKRFNDPYRFNKDIERIKGFGIFIWGSFVLGFDEDDVHSLERTITMAKSSKLDFACFNFLTPLPGTKVYDRFEKENRVLNKDWGNYNMANVVFQPKKLSSKELKHHVKRAWLEFYSLKAICHRLGSSMGKIRLFVWLVNLALWFYTRKKLKWA